MMGSRGTSPAEDHRQALAALSELMQVLQPLLSQPAIAEQLVELAAREAGVATREAALRQREALIREAIATLGAAE
jgi:hypothetical protein